MTEPNVKQLIAECQEALKYSYCPYSKFPVGAALEAEDGTIFRGCNIENAAFPVSICAERTAYAKAISDGITRFKAIAITSAIPAPDVIVPCGGCRQFMREFSEDLIIYLVRTDNSYQKTSLEVLLPLSFGPSNLAKGQTS